MNFRYLLLLLLLPSLNAAAQPLTEKKFDYYTTEWGLSHNYITCIAQDSAGYVWLGTSSGVNRFNGSRFVQFHSSSDSNSMASEEVGGMAWLDKYRLAVFTTGVHIIDTRTGKTRNLFIPYHDKRYQFKFNMIMRALGDANGDVYVLTRSGFYHYDKDYNLVSRFDYYKEQSVPLEHFFFGRDLFELDSKRLLIGSIDGLYVYDKSSKKIKKMAPQDCPALTQQIIHPELYTKYFEVRPGEFFVMTLNNDSIYYINTIKNKIVGSRVPFQAVPDDFHYRTKLIAISNTDFYLTGHNSGFYKLKFDPVTCAVTLFPEKYFQSHLCTGMLKDKDGLLWIATNRGVYRQNPQKSAVQVADLPSGIEDIYPDVRVDDIYVLGDKLYAGTRQAGLFVYDRKTMELQKALPLTYEGKPLSIRAITALNNSTLMLGTEGPVMLFDVNKQSATQLNPPNWQNAYYWTSDLYRETKGNIWISSYYIYNYDPATGKYSIIPYPANFPSQPFGIKGDKDGNIWLGGHGLARYNVKKQQYDISLDSFPAIKIMDKQVSAPEVVNENELWFSSNNNGLICYNLVTKKFIHFTRSNGLPDDNISSMIVVGNKLWLGCVSGIACMDLRTHEIVSFGKEDGFPGMQIAKGARFFYDEPMHQLYIGFSAAVVRFNPDSILKKKNPPQTFIENLAIGKKNVFLPGQSFTTSWQDNDVRISIGTINFSDGNIQRFAYRIFKDANTPWVQLGSQPSFSISNLSPGTHRIQVKTFAPNNRWPEQLSELSLVVTPPLWRQDWFIGVMIAFALVLLYLFIKWRTNLVREKEMEKTQIEKIKADHYKNQFELEQISNYFSSSLAGKKNADEVLWDVAANLIGRMNYEDCIIYMWNDKKTKMVQKAAYGPKGKPGAINEQVFEVLPGQGIVGHAIITKQPVLVNDTRTDNRYRVDDSFRLSEVCVPIIHNDELLGIIDSEHHLPNYFSERDIKILTTIATLIGNKLKQIASEQSLDAKRKELATINEQLAEARLSALQAQMNPHFVFNALNSIKRMILDGDNEKASRYLSKFALMIRMTLNHSKELFVTLDENIAYLKAYLEMEQLRFDDSFTYSIYTGDNIDASETPVPSMMIQPLVENAIWHGLMQAENEKNLKIKFTEQDNKITCTVEDNGIGIRQSEKQKEKTRPHHQSVGLENLQKRIKIMNEKYDMDCSLHITDLKETGINGNGTRVILKFNMINT